MTGDEDDNTPLPNDVPSFATHSVKAMMKLRRPGRPWDFASRRLCGDGCPEIGMENVNHPGRVVKVAAPNTTPSARRSYPSCRCSLPA